MRFPLPSVLYNIIWLSLLLPAPAAATQLTIPSVWQEPTSKMEFIEVPGGCFPMGDTFGDGEHNEVPVHETCVDSFFIGRYEVTQGVWKRIMGGNPAMFREGDNYPVENINLQDIEEFILRMNQLGTGVYRLPTETEWEYACRAGGQKIKFSTPDGAFSPEQVNVDNPEGDSWSETSQVGTFPPNALGIHDMSGNVWEWVEDIYASDAYSKHKKLNPLYRGMGPSRLVRGGAWSHESQFARCSKRHMHCRPSVRYDIIGIRLVRETNRGQ